MATRIAAVAPGGLQAPARMAPPCAVVIFGASGDLTRRKLIPALFNLWAGGLVAERFAILGVARRPLDDHAFREDLCAAVREFSRVKPKDAAE